MRECLLTLSWSMPVPVPGTVQNNASPDLKFIHSPQSKTHKSQTRHKPQGRHSSPFFLFIVLRSVSTQYKDTGPCLPCPRVDRAHHAYISRLETRACLEQFAVSK